MASENDVTGTFGMDTCDGILCALSFEATLCIIHSQPVSRVMTFCTDPDPRFKSVYAYLTYTLQRPSRNAHPWGR